MLTTFLAALNPMLTLFLCIVIGFTLKKLNILPDNASKVASKLVVWIFSPALTFSSLARYFTVDTLKIHAKNLTMAVICLAMAIATSIILSRLFVKKPCYERNVYTYALAFANTGYMGDPLVEAVFGTEVLSYYKFVCIPISIAIYTWGVSILVPKDKEDNGNLLKKLLNPPLVSTFLGMAVGLICGFAVKDVPVGTTAYDVLLPDFITSTLDSLKACMGPTAMILAGITIAKYNIAGMFKKKKVYVATALRLIVIPAVFSCALFGIKELINLIFSLSIDNTPIFLLFFAIATPLGLNTIIFPEAYNGDPEIGASMTMVSHTLCVITIPLLFALATAIFGGNTWLPI